MGCVYYNYVKQTVIIPSYTFICNSILIAIFCSINANTFISFIFNNNAFKQLLFLLQVDFSNYLHNIRII